MDRYLIQFVLQGSGRDDDVVCYELHAIDHEYYRNTFEIFVSLFEELKPRDSFGVRVIQ